MSAPPFAYIAGTGGIGKGDLFMLEGNYALGRNESRLGRLTDFEDYCKLHIILHYAATLTAGKLPVYAVGRVGADANGEALVRQMQAAGIDTAHVRQDETAATMYAVCYQFPNGEGGNITASNSACSLVDMTDIANFFECSAPPGRGLLVAAPEVPMAARLELLREGRRRGCYNVVSFLSGEAEAFIAAGGLALADLLAINRDEAEAVLQAAGIGGASLNAASACADFLRRENPDIAAIITDGGSGAYCLSGNNLQKIETIPSATIASTAGAGDCLIGTTMAALACGIPLQAPQQPGLIASAAELGNFAAGLKVQSRHSIHFGLDRQMLSDYAAVQQIRFSDTIQRLFFQASDTRRTP